MSIQEKPQLLEFNCKIEGMEGMEGVEWNIKYDPSNKIGLCISGNGQNFHCPVELFGDVTDFLRSKNIIKSNIHTREVKKTSTLGFAQGSFSGSLPLPEIKGQEEVASVDSGPPMDALASFDITQVQVIDKTDTAQVPTNNIINSKDKNESEVINRPVIRTIVNKDDHMSAEKERESITGNAEAKKVVKKRHRVE